MQIVGYPEELEKWWLNYCSRDVIDDQAGLERHIRRMSELFTTHRELIQDYWKDQGLFTAYALFYFPQTFVRIQFPLVEVFSRGLRPSQQTRVLDLGCGTGAAGLSAVSLLNQLKETQSVQVKFVDRSPVALEPLSRLIKDLKNEFWPQLNERIEISDLWNPDALSGGPWDIILLSFSLNETFPSLNDLTIHVKRLMSQLSPQGLLLIVEPATQSNSELLEQLRDEITTHEGHFVWAPCLHQKACPLLRERNFWCHEVRNWEAAETQRFLNRHLHRELHVLKYSFLALSPATPPVYPSTANYFRMISPLSKTKGKFAASGCATDGQKHKYEILSRHLHDSNRKHLSLWQRGNCLKIAQLEQIGNVNRVIHPSAVEGLE